MNIIFNASAGTGKTRQVTELYSALVLGLPHKHLPKNHCPVSPEKILLMTFTDNAAVELRERVSKKMIAEKRVASKENDDELADRVRRVLRILPAATISTIHAFCTGLLRKYALECGLSPRFQTLKEEERDALLNEVLRKNIFQQLEKNPDFREFCAGISVLGDSDYSLINTIRSLFETAANRGLNLNRAETLLPKPVEASMEEIQRCCDELRTMIDSRSNIPATLKPVSQWLKRWEGTFPPIGNPDIFASELDCFGKFGQVKGCKEISSALNRAKEQWKTTYDYKKKYTQFQAFARCLAESACDFAEAKRMRDRIDFGDQLLLTRDLLKTNPFKAPPFEWLIVDEVQDTSRIQCEVIEALWNAKTNLVICGDRKQSIYAWRSADPQVMPDLEAMMKQRGDYKKIALKQSYRSKDRILDIVNKLFLGIYGKEYDDETLEAVESIGALTAEKNEGPCVEFLIQDNEKDSTKHEMAAVARRIRLLVSGDKNWCPQFGHNGETFSAGEPFNYGDILILLKRSTHQPILEKALRDLAIPYTSGGKGRVLFEQQEVRDILLFLQVLCEPFNDLALIGFLRSPFANLPDETLVELGWNGETFNHNVLYTQFLEKKSLAAERLLRYRAWSGEKRPSQLVREIVWETAYDAQLAGSLGGEQKLANFKKALDWLRNAERGGQVLLSDVTRQFEQYIQTPPTSGAAEALLPDPQKNRVTLMTVHSAKGLTKRVCFIPDISFGENNRQGFAVFSPEGRIEMNYSNLTGKKTKSPGWETAHTQDKKVRLIERMNLFYVAMTRARDLTILSGAGTKKSKGWWIFSEKFLKKASVDILRRLNYSEIPMKKYFATKHQISTKIKPHLPLRIPMEMDREPVTNLIDATMSKKIGTNSVGNHRAFGTLGHVVLEELARTNWIGEIRAIVDIFSNAFDLSEKELKTLTEQLETACDLLQKETAGAEALFPEYPFVLKRGNKLLDGTIDLLVQMSPKEWKVLDYKFTTDSPCTMQKIYAPQLAAYREAVEKLNPDAKVSAALVLINQTVRILPETLPGNSQQNRSSLNR